MGTPARLSFAGYFGLVGSILDRSISIFGRNPLGSLAILLATLLAGFAVGLVLYTMLLGRYMTLFRLMYLVIGLVSPLATAAFSDMVSRQARGLPWNLFSVLRSGVRRLGAQLVIIAIGAPILYVLDIGVLEAYTSGAQVHNALASWLSTLGIGLPLAVQVLIVAVFALESIAICSVRWESVTPASALRRAAARLFERPNLWTSVILIFALGAVYMLLHDAALVPLALTGHPPWVSTATFRLADVLFYTYACLTFAVYYFKLSESPSPVGVSG